MEFDIYGNSLRSGYCEVHPQVNEDYPCSLCYAENQRKDMSKNNADEYWKQQEKQMYADMEMKQTISDLSRRASILERLVKLYKEKDDVYYEYEKGKRILLSDHTDEGEKLRQIEKQTEILLDTLPSLTSQIAALRKEAGV